MRNLILALVILISLISKVVYADLCASAINGPNPNNPPCNCEGSGGPGQASPVFVKSGGYITTAQDLQLPTRGFSLAFSRTYRSATPVDGFLGPGWSMDIATHITYTAYLYSAPSTYQLA